MNLTAAQIRYLLVIYRLNKKGSIHSWEIAESLDVSRPSAHRMVRQLLKKDLIAKEEYSLISLTEKGRRIAGQYCNGYSHILEFLRVFLNLPTDAAAAGALSILSEIDPEMLKGLCIIIDENLSEKNL